MAVCIIQCLINPGAIPCPIQAGGIIQLEIRAEVEAPLSLHAVLIHRQSYQILTLAHSQHTGISGATTTTRGKKFIHFSLSRSILHLLSTPPPKEVYIGIISIRCGIPHRIWFTLLNHRRPNLYILEVVDIFFKPWLSKYMDACGSHQGNKRNTEKWD